METILGLINTEYIARVSILSGFTAIALMLLKKKSPLICLFTSIILFTILYYLLSFQSNTSTEAKINFIVALYLSGLPQTIPLFLATKTTEKLKKIIYHLSIFSTFSNIYYIILFNSDHYFIFVLRLSLVLFLIALLLSLTPPITYLIRKFYRHIINPFIPKNYGIKRLCFIISITLCFVSITNDWNYYGLHCPFSKYFNWLGILYITSIFCIPFIITKITAFIIDGFKQSQKQQVGQNV